MGPAHGWMDAHGTVRLKANPIHSNTPRWAWPFHFPSVRALGLYITPRLCAISLAMSLLRQALRSRASRSNLQDAEGSSSPPSKKSYAKSIRSVASVKTLAASLTSFYTKTVGPSGAAGTPKQRWSPRSELGKPAFPSKSPELRLVDGVESCNDDIVSGVGTVRTQDERVSLLIHHLT
ncbi:hypothetical protein RSOLAG1IB_05330 [Rhizoctonia solani AG-1 IB]|uniref:Uncharacterized protein n=1 Tax=Thanatephorus cucumeris (strain AG1-IB / isolate 7/3/14) TaxID=1108050 RepID=A0A0B7G4A2_THACB|nr:hypothetical protein RSOLAG1IB_05330 [Rhizoctonia solani AG-1 IB]